MHLKNPSLQELLISMITFPTILDETEKEITEAIVKITMNIKENFPERSKYIEEMEAK